VLSFSHVNKFYNLAVALNVRKLVPMFRSTAILVEAVMIVIANERSVQIAARNLRKVLVPPSISSCHNHENQASV